MTPANLEYLLSKRTKLKYLVQSKSGNIDAKERENLQRIHIEEFGGGPTDLWCPSCIFKMVEKVHKRFEEWMKAEEERAAAIKVEASFPKHEGEPEWHLYWESEATIEPIKPTPKRKNHKRK